MGNLEARFLPYCLFGYILIRRYLFDQLSRGEIGVFVWLSSKCSSLGWTHMNLSGKSGSVILHEAAKPMAGQLVSIGNLALSDLYRVRFFPY
ncbi:hypothetical protein Nepgr_014058 [Nepenthes gracilis]|uniref:Uncharacterized protein n=1 Tax=Nepenthes gracilis TaxID=150966 RepID=A0AAD3SJC8_NEPGR|nr:hypothetical protein Nepgr_014058 [Nepenthes gracilis]